ncbi:MAG: ABC transporter substrate binding protein, partial [bacterium]|nr:ABC transporter substrate binding protein [bacterium]
MVGGADIPFSDIDRVLRYRTADTGAIMRRREFVAGSVMIAAGTRVAAQPVANGRRLAIVDLSTPISRMYENSESYYRVLFTELRRLGQIEGQNLTVERYAKEQNPSDSAAFAAQVVRSTPDVIFVLVPLSVFIKATSKIPIVTITGDPVAAGYVQSLARPGGNITGVSVDAGPSIHGKRIALLREMLPSMSRLGCIAGRATWEHGTGAAVRAAADAAGLSLVSQLVDLPGNATTYGNAIEQAARDGSDAIMILDSPDVFANRVSIVQSIAETRIPAIHAFTGAVDAGGLMAYAF